MNSATRTAGTTERIGPNIGTSSKSPASTPTPRRTAAPAAQSHPRQNANDQRQGELTAQIAPQYARDVVLQKQGLRAVLRWDDGEASLAEPGPVHQQIQ